MKQPLQRNDQATPSQRTLAQSGLWLKNSWLIVSSVLSLVMLLAAWMNGKNSSFDGESGTIHATFISLWTAAPPHNPDSPQRIQAG